MNIVLAGYGEVGRAVNGLFSIVHDIEIHDPRKGFYASGSAPGLLVTFPYSENFIDRVKMYAEVCETKFVIIFSTVPIGTTRQIDNAVHCPVEGRHPNLQKSMYVWKWVVGGKNELAERFFYEASITPIVYPEPEWTEFLKLSSTLNYGLNIEWARYCKEVSDKIGMPYCALNEYTAGYNALYSGLNEPGIKRYNLTPPGGKIGGHCILPNAEMLQNIFPNPLIEYILKVNKEKT